MGSPGCFGTIGTIRSKFFILCALFTIFITSQIPAFATDNTWEDIGPYRGDITSVAVSPNYVNDGIIAAWSRTFEESGEPSGLYLSSNGSNWTSSYAYTPLFVEDYGSRVVYSPNFAIDNTMFIVIDANQVKRSTDGGQTWSDVSVGASTQITALNLSPDYGNDDTAFSATDLGILKTTDGGDNWVATSMDASSSSVVVSPAYADDGTVFGSESRGISKSIDGGDTWELISLSGSNDVIELAISPDFTNDQTILAGGNYYDSAIGPESLRGIIYRSTNGGGSWSTLDIGATWIDEIKFSPNFVNDGTVAAADRNGQLYISTDGGLSFSAYYVTSIVEPEVHSIAFSPNYAIDSTIFAGTLYGLFESVNNGLTWELVGSVQGSWTWDIALSPEFATDNTMLAALAHGTYQMNRTYSLPAVVLSDDGGGVFRETIGYSLNDYLSVLAISPDYGTDGTIFAGGNGSNLLRSTNGGLNWTSIASFDATIIKVSPAFATDNTVVIGNYYGGIWKGQINFSSWINLGFNDTAVFDIEMSPNYASDEVIYAGTSKGLYRSLNGGLNWKKLTNGLPKGAEITNLAISPNFENDTVLYAIASTANKNSAYSGYVSTNGGNDWVKLPGVNPYVLEVSPNFAQNSTVYAQADGGFKISIDGGRNWVDMPGGGDWTIDVCNQTDAMGNDSCIFSSGPYGIYKYSQVLDRFEEDDDRVVTSPGCWQNITEPTDIEIKNGIPINSALWTRSKGCAASVYFQSGSFGLISAVGPGMGKAKVYIDGVYQRTLDLYSPELQTGKKVYLKYFDDDESHIVSVVATGGKNSRSKGNIIVIDGFELDSVSD